MSAGGFSCSLDVLHEGLRVNILQFLTNFKIFQSCKILVIKFLDRDPGPIPIRIDLNSWIGTALKPMQIDKTDRSRNLKDLVKSDQGKIILDPQQRSSQEHDIKKLLTRSVWRLFLFFLMRFLTRVDFSCLQKDAVRGGLGSPSIPLRNITLIIIVDFSYLKGHC